MYTPKAYPEFESRSLRKPRNGIAAQLRCFFDVRPVENPVFVRAGQQKAQRERRDRNAIPGLSAPAGAHEIATAAGRRNLGPPFFCFYHCPGATNVPLNVPSVSFYPLFRYYRPIIWSVSSTLEVGRRMGRHSRGWLKACNRVITFFSERPILHFSPNLNRSRSAKTLFCVEKRTLTFSHNISFQVTTKISEGKK